MWAAEAYKLCVGLVPGADTYNPADDKHSGHAFQCGISSAVSLAVGADASCVFSAEMDAWALPSEQWCFLPCRADNSGTQQHWKPLHYLSFP